MSLERLPHCSVLLVDVVAASGIHSIRQHGMMLQAHLVFVDQYGGPVARAFDLRAERMIGSKYNMYQVSCNFMTGHDVSVVVVLRHNKWEG